LGLLAGAVGNAEAGTLTIERITANASSADTATVESQITITYNDATFNSVNGIVFNITNSGSFHSDISEIYIQNIGGLLAAGSASNPAIFSKSSGIGWDVTGANPSALPGQTGFFTSDTTLSTQATNPSASNGIISDDADNQSLSLFFAYAPGADFAQVETALFSYNPDSSPNAGISLGLHIQAIGINGKSDAFVTIPGTGSTPPSTPLPAAAWSGMALIGGLGVLRKMPRKA
jgi:hypothetical protein